MGGGREYLHSVESSLDLCHPELSGHQRRTGLHLDRRRRENLNKTQIVDILLSTDTIYCS